MGLNSLTFKAVSEIVPLLSGSRRKKTISTLIYHRVLETHDYMRPSEPDELQFSTQMELIAKYCNPLSLSDAVKRMEAGTLPERAVCVTFDDGYADNADIALPILLRWGIPATVFVSTGYIDGGRMWNDKVIDSLKTSKANTLDLSEFKLNRYQLRSDNDRRSAARSILSAIKHLEPKERESIAEVIWGMRGGNETALMMDAGQIKKIYANGIDVGGHTHSHPILSTLEDEEAKAEILTGKKHLESIVSSPLNAFAYPNGRPDKDFFPRHRDMVAELGFSVAVTTQQGVASKASDHFLIPRFTPWDKDPKKFLLRLMLNTRNVV